jgi:AAA domain
MSKIINLFGGPGIGKSTQAAGLYTEMKRHHMNVEYTYEFPKEVAWEGNISQLKDQFFITANQHRNISRLYGKVDYIIVDSPIVLGCFYEQRYGNGYPGSFYSKSCFDKFLWSLFNQYDNINILLKRNNDNYDPNGRMQDLKEAIEIDNDIKETLDINSVPYIEFMVDNDTAFNIFNYIKANNT